MRLFIQCGQKAKQLSWDRAYDSEDNLFFVEHFDPAFYMRENQTEDAPQMHSSCSAMLSKLVCKIAGQTLCCVLTTIWPVLDF